MVVLWGPLRLTLPASESVPVFTDHLSLPQCCWASSGPEKILIEIARPSIVINRACEWDIIVLLSSEIENVANAARVADLDRMELPSLRSASSAKQSREGVALDARTLPDTDDD